MKIGIDIDGVITNIERVQLDYGAKFCSERNMKGIINPSGYYCTDIFGWTKEDDDLFWGKYFEAYCKNEKPRPFASEVIKKIKDQGNEIYIITARNNGGWNLQLSNKIEDITRNWLKENNIVYDALYFSAEDKFKICSENKIDLMIEDKPENINNLSKIIPVICFDNIYNKKCEGDNILRCYSWYDIYDKITKIK